MLQPRTIGPCNLNRRRVLAGLTMPFLGRPALALAQEGWLARPIRFIIPFPPGGPTDAVGRLLAVRLTERLGTNVVIENQGGAGGALGMERLSRGAPDGSVIGLGTTGTHAINRHLYARLAYDPVRGFTPISTVIEHINMLVVPTAHPAQSLADLLRLAGSGTLTYGSAGNGSSNHLSAALLAMRTGLTMQHVPFRGSAPAMAEVVAGRLDFMFDTLAALPQVEGGRVRVLAVTGPQRHPPLPTVPAIAESVPDYSVVAWFGIFAPPNLPDAIGKTLNQTVVSVVGEAETGEKLRGLGLEPVAGTPVALAEKVARDDALWGPVVKSAGLHPE